MESPINVGDTTTNSIQNLLSETHINTPRYTSTINSAVYSGLNVIQLTLTIQNPKNEDGDSGKASKVIILRRVQDSYVNISQLLSILVKMGHFNQTRLNNFLNNEIITNPQYSADEKGINVYVDWVDHEVKQLRGLWISYDKAVSLALKFDIYELTKLLFLVDVHSFEDLPKIYESSSKRASEELDESDTEMASPLKRQKISQADEFQSDIDIRNATITMAKENPNNPYTLIPLEIKPEDADLVSDIKQKYSEIFKKDSTSEASYELIKSLFQDLPKIGPDSVHSLTDIALDQQGKTALHFAASLASQDLVSHLASLKLCSPIRGTSHGESPLVSMITVTNAMEKGNFVSLLDSWLWPCLFLLDNNNWSFLHYMISQYSKKAELSNFYSSKILEWLISSDLGKSNNLFYKFLRDVLNTKDKKDGNTALHLASEKQAAWFIELLVALKADVNVPNKMGVKPIDYDIVKDILSNKKPGENASRKDSDGYLFELISTNVDLIEKKEQLGVNGVDDVSNIPSEIESSTHSNCTTDSQSSKILQSINHLLLSSNKEYERIIRSKKKQISSISEQLHQSTIITANNKFLVSKISEKLMDLENLKVQMSNISEKLQLIQKELPEEKADLKEDEEVNTDEPYIIKPIYDKVISYEDAKFEPDEELLSNIPSTKILKARIKAYEEINNKMESEFEALADYSELTSKFKKVVSFCTGVSENEVDELLDGLLEAVESQQ
ncbi:Piso0_005601 [Millerozyma farinosa CBS 7064]|uniref:Piso0_005601 protein n=1 Tax=Pichia sorbitophila (strain ATCC MYA-4447 / BCRC 22081 / CBS 7064 / NBRC 10061 / NRRL Y-12695) TaxID=559304 RepID=G8Y2E8_PICSO|nr:Piso0_005601 [Millerozyma farinosa CBS 7064]